MEWMLSWLTKKSRAYQVSNIWGGFFQDSKSKWYYFYWGDTVKVKPVYGYFNGSRSDVTAYLKREDDMGNNNKEYHEAVYVKGDFSKSVKEGQRLTRVL